ncbi:uncharacterized protein [Pyrus communis]|uniref:uncharacterized protein n=1 Tax=Pyrus communis TaxID=23211 RepID=UPI0035BFAA5A
MDCDRVTRSCNSPLLFDGTNYVAWSEKIQIFLEAQDLIFVDYLTSEWKALSRIVNGESVVKAKGEQTQGEISSDRANRKAWNAIVSAISPTQFAHIRYWTTAKLAWDKLKILHVGDKQVKMLTNEALGLGKPIDKISTVQKILRTLSKTFQAKKATIYEFQDLNEIKLGKLVGKLINEMELDMDEGDFEKNKEVALQSFKRILKTKGNEVKRTRESSINHIIQPHEKLNLGRKQEKFVDKRDKSFSNVHGPCFAYGGNGHQVAEYANNKVSSQKRDKAMMGTWSNSEDEVSNNSGESSDTEEDVVVFVASVKKVSSDNDEVTLNDDEKMSYQELSTMYKSLFDETCAAKLNNVELNLKIIKLQEKVESLQLVRIDE